MPNRLELDISLLSLVELFLAIFISRKRRGEKSYRELKIMRRALGTYQKGLSALLFHHHARRELLQEADILVYIRGRRMASNKRENAKYKRKKKKNTYT
jgi:hypothetical protein